MPKRHSLPTRAAAVFIGGMVGTAGRIGVAELLGNQSFPWATLIVNILGAGILGFLVVRLIHHAGTAGVAFAGVGVLGSFTTFGTFVAEADALKAGSSATYVAVSLATGLLAARIGMAAAR